MPVSLVATLGIPLVEGNCCCFLCKVAPFTAQRRRYLRRYWCALPFSSPESSLLLRACYLRDVSLPSKLYSAPALTCVYLPVLNGPYIAYTMPQRPCLSMWLYNGRLRSNIAVMCKRARIPMGITRMRQQCIPGRFFLPRKKWPGNEATIVGAGSAHAQLWS